MATQAAVQASQLLPRASRLPLSRQAPPPLPPLPPSSSHPQLLPPPLPQAAPAMARHVTVAPCLGAAPRCPPLSRPPLRPISQPVRCCAAFPPPLPSQALLAQVRGLSPSTLTCGPTCNLTVTSYRATPGAGTRLLLACLDAFTSSCAGAGAAAAFLVVILLCGVLLLLPCPLVVFPGGAVPHAVEGCV